MRAKDNKFLIVDKRVILTTAIETVIVALDPYFQRAGVKANVTSGLRDPDHQLSLIRGFLAKSGLDRQYPEAMSLGLKDKIPFQGQQVYSWQPGWSALLNSGIVISPPLEAVCLMDYIHKSGENRKGKVIHASPHFKGTAFDIGGGVDGIEGNASNELKIVQEAQRSGVRGISDVYPERKNNCVHVDCVNY